MNFNPRTPHGVRPLAPDSPAVSTVFQSTHPSRGATCPSNSRIACIIISIHAPLTGCDPRRNRYPQPPTNFNPRTPHGVRRLSGLSLGVHNCISIHAPLTGCDCSCIGAASDIAGFQSTHPSRGATPGLNRHNIFPPISIHAPLTGCDEFINCVYAD